jgi:predicted nucleic acid-binding protein
MEEQVSFVDVFQIAYVSIEGLKGILSFDREYDGLGIKRVEQDKK